MKKLLTLLSLLPGLALGGGTSSLMLSFGDSASPPFNPLDIPGLAVWYDASDTATITFTAAPNINTVSDKSGNGNTLTRVAGAPQSGIDTINGLNVITYPAGPDAVLTTTGPPTGLSGPDFTAFVVTKIDFNLTGFAGVMGMTNAGWTSGWRMSDSAGSGAQINGSVNTYFAAPSLGPIISADTTALLELTWDEAAERLTSYVDGVQIQTDSALTIAVSYSNDLRVGSVDGGSDISGPTPGLIGEVLIYSGTILSTGDRQLVENYLIAKWGL